MTGKMHSRPPTPDDPFHGDSSVFNDFDPVPRIVKSGYQTVISNEAIFDLNISHNGQQMPQSAFSTNNYQYMSPQQYMLPQGKDDSLELEDYVQGLNDRFELPSDQLHSMTPRCSFEQGNYSSCRIFSLLRPG
jgi:hypothetical protein